MALQVGQQHHTLAVTGLGLNDALWPFLLGSIRPVVANDLDAVN